VLICALASLTAINLLRHARGNDQPAQEAGNASHSDFMIA
jgi:hypothetical protein